MHFWLGKVAGSTPVGGIWIPTNKFGLLTPYIALASTILVATAATAIYVKHAKRRKKKQ
jgi:energy-converting hydrogenase Eha subunit H